MVELFLLVSLSVAAPQSPTGDTIQRVRRDAQRAAHHYEALLRRRAPEGFGSGRGRCDEFIGRFCFRFTAGPSEPPEPEHPDVGAARRRAITAYRAWFAHEPGVPAMAGPLVRFLVEEGRAGEAVAAARTHAWAAERTPASLMLLGLARHHSGAFGAAESAFDSARRALPAVERARLDDVAMLLEPAEARWYAGLGPESREAYNARFWAFSDPSRLQAGNERRSAHYARHAWTTILADAPRVRGRPTWASDLEEIVLRYGLPTSRERVDPYTWRIDNEFSMIERYDPHAVALVPPAMATLGLWGEPVPGVRSELERDTARSSYAPIELHRMRGLTVQATRFVTRRGALLAVSGALPVDTAPPVPPDTVSPSAPREPRGLIVVLDTLGTEVVRAPARVRVGADSVTEVDGQVELAPGAYVYWLEVVDESTGLGGLARHRIDVPTPGRPGLSDLLVGVAESDSDSVPLSREAVVPSRDLVFPVGRRVVIWAEAWGLSRGAGEARFSVEWWIEEAEDPGALVRAARWVGRRLGLGDEERPVRVRWEASTTENPAPIAFAVDLDGMDPGLYRLGLMVRDRISGREAASERVLRVAPRSPR